MRHTIALLLIAFLSPLASAADTPALLNQRGARALADKAVRFDFDAVSVGQVVRAIYADTLQTPYVLDPVLLQDNRLVSFRWGAQNGDLRAFMARFLDSLGFVIETRNGIDFVKPKPQEEKGAEQKDWFVYQPKYRDGAYLADLVAPLLKGTFTIKRAVAAPLGEKMPASAVPPTSAAALVDRGADTLVFGGSSAECVKVAKLLSQLDTPQGEVMVRGVVYEVSTTDTTGNALQLATSLLGGRANISIGAATSALDSILHIKTGNFDAVLSALTSDSHFKVVSSPSLRVRSGATASFNVGQDVPVLGAVSYPGNGTQPVQSVEYRSSGVIFEVSPQVRAARVDLNLTHQMSNFVETTTGVNGSPTLIKRELKTQLSVESGEMIVLGGLDEDKQTESHKGLPFLPDWLRNRAHDQSRSEVLLVLEVRTL